LSLEEGAGMGGRNQRSSVGVEGRRRRADGVDVDTATTHTIAAQRSIPGYE
jgi:hypothetical protein